MAPSFSVPLEPYVASNKPRTSSAVHRPLNTSGRAPRIPVTGLQDGASSRFPELRVLPSYLAVCRGQGSLPTLFCSAHGEFIRLARFWLIDALQLRSHVGADCFDPATISSEHNFCSLDSYKHIRQKMEEIASKKEAATAVSAPQPSILHQEALPTAALQPCDIACDPNYERPGARLFAEQIHRRAEAILSQSASSMAKPASLLEYRMRINRRICQIANSKAQIRQVVNDLLILYNESDAQLRVPLVQLIVDKILVVCHPASAFPIAFVIVELAQRIQSFMTLFLDGLFKRSPYAIPLYIKKQEGQSEFSCKLAMCYKAKDNKIVEDDSHYFDRMSSYVYLYAAVVQTVPLSSFAKNSHGVENGWKWLASILNLPPRPITANLVAAFLEIAGFALLKTYKQHFASLLVFIINDFIPKIPKQAIAAKTRLEVFVRAAFKGSHFSIKEPEGKNPEH